MQHYIELFSIMFIIIVMFIIMICQLMILQKSVTSIFIPQNKRDSLYA